MVTVVGNKVFLSITMLVVEFVTPSAGADLLGSRMTLLGEDA
jgi:hypothetical protein